MQKRHNNLSAINLKKHCMYIHISNTENEIIYNNNSVASSVYKHTKNTYT